MPRTPAPLTVSESNVEGLGDGWLVWTADKRIVAFFYSEADARAFVALPALLEAAKDVLDWQESCLAIGPGTDHGLALNRKLRAALAAADGPSQEQG